MVQKILRYPDKQLHEKSRPVTDFTTLPALVADMFETMHAAKGVGLAAIQIGVPLRAFVVDSPVSPEHQVFVNPSIVAGNGTLIDEEGCLSFPKILVRVSRRERVYVQAQDVTGSPFTVDASGFFARALQHEIDHLNGRVLADYVGSFKRESIKQQLRARG